MVLLISSRIHVYLLFFLLIMIGPVQGEIVDELCCLSVWLVGLDFSSVSRESSVYFSDRRPFL